MWGVLALIAFLVASAIAFQDNLFRYSMDPRAPFQMMAAPPAPDYASPAAWAARPSAPTPGRPAIFFVHPTTFWGGDAWNAAIDAPIPATRVDQSALPNYAGAFAPLGDLWAPRYRQASLYSSLAHRFDPLLARRMAYDDVHRAFLAFLAEAPADAPILLVGVEQGGLHVLGLLQDELIDEELRKRLVAAYVIDQATPLDLFDNGLSHIGPCAEPEQTGCVVSWGAVEADNTDRIQDFRRRSMVWMDDGRLEATEGRALLCVNPILGTTGEDFTPRRTHLGGVNATGLSMGVEPAPMPAQTSAQCSDGVLLIDRPTSPSLRDGWSWGMRFKPRTAFLFYADARRDAARRLAAFETRRLAETPPPPEEPRELPPLEPVEIPDAPIHKVD
jgi:hypothetical protein